MIVIVAAVAYYFLAKEPAEKLVCGTCGEEFDTQTELEDHMIFVHHEIPETIPREKTFRISTIGEGPIPQLNPLNPEVAEGTTNLITYEPLAIFSITTPPSSIYGILAEDWGWVNETTFEIHLWPEAHFWDGTPVTASDVVFSLEAANEYVGIASMLFEKDLESIGAVGDHTIRINLKDEAANSLSVWEVFDASILPKDQWGKIVDEWGENIVEFPNLDFWEMNGSGPYRIISNTSESAIFKRVENYWGNWDLWPSLPEYFQLLWVDSDTKAHELAEKGMADRPGCLCPATWEVVEHTDSKWSVFNMDAENPRVKAALATSGGMRYIWLNFDKVPLFREPWLRYAMAYAIDTPEGAATANEPAVKPSASLLGGVSDEYFAEDIIKATFETERGANGVLGIKYDPEKAIEILQEHCEGSVEEGWTYKGEKVGGWTAEIVDWGGWSGSMHIYVSQWEEIGLNIELNVVNDSIWETDFNAGKIEITEVMLGGGGITPEYYFSLIGTQEQIGMWEPYSPCGYETWFPDTAPEVKDLIEQMCYVPVGSDDAIELARKIQEIVIPQLPMIPEMVAVWSGYYREGVWTNWNSVDDPYPIIDPEYHSLRVYPVKVETVDVSLSPEEVGVGEPATVSVTLKNTGTVEYNYAVIVSLGSAKPELVAEATETSGIVWVPSLEKIAQEIVIIKAGETKTVELEVSFDAPGTYTLTVDQWRIGKYDPGDPVELTLEVT